MRTKLWSTACRWIASISLRLRRSRRRRFSRVWSVALTVVIGLVVILLFLAMSVHIERTASQLAFNAKAAAAVVDTKNNSPNLLEHQITDVRKGPAYRTGGIYFTNHYAASYVSVPNNFYFTAYNMRLYAWLFALFGIAVGFIVGIQTRASLALRQWASWLAVAACCRP